MRRHIHTRHPLTSFKISLVSAAIVLSLAACSGEGTGTTPTTIVIGAATPEEERVFYALPGMEFSHFEETEDGLAFVSDSTPGFEAAASDPDAIEIDWRDSSEAVQYQVYRRETQTQLLDDALCNDEQFTELDTFTNVATLTESFYVDQDVSRVVRYEYRVLAVDVDQERRTIASGLVVSVAEATNALASLRAQPQEPQVVTIPPAAQPEAPTTGEAVVPTSNTDSSPVVDPAEPSTPSEPETNPDTAGGGGSPFDPVPEEPAAPATPDAPDAPVEPVTPDAPEAPVESETPDAPATPDASVDAPDTDTPPTVEPDVIGCGNSGLDGGETPASAEEETLGESGEVIVAEEPSVSPALVFPDPSQTLSGSSMEFMWELNETTATQWWLRAGSHEDAFDYFDSGRITNANTTSLNVTGLPTDGSQVHIQLSYKKSDGQWGTLRYVFDTPVLASVVPTAAPPSTGAANGTNEWDNTMRPPTLVNPIEIVMGSDYPTIDIPDFDRVNCDGKIHRINIPYDQDALITMAPGSEALKYAVFVYGGRNVHIRGLEMRTIVQDGCDVGEATQVRDTRANIHPRLPGGKVFRLEQSGTTFIEGVDIDLKGQEADCFVLRNPSDMSIAEALDDRHIFFVNTRCTGIEGLDDSPIGDGLHGDFFQNQGTDSFGY